MAVGQRQVQQDQVGLPLGKPLSAGLQRGGPVDVEVNRTLTIEPLSHQVGIPLIVLDQQDPDRRSLDCQTVPVHTGLFFRVNDEPSSPLVAPWNQDLRRPKENNWSTW